MVPPLETAVPSFGYACLLIDWRQAFCFGADRGHCCSKKGGGWEWSLKKLHSPLSSSRCYQVKFIKILFRNNQLSGVSNLGVTHGRSWSVSIVQNLRANERVVGAESIFGVPTIALQHPVVNNTRLLWINFTGRWGHAKSLCGLFCHRVCCGRNLQLAYKLPENLGKGSAGRPICGFLFFSLQRFCKAWIWSNSAWWLILFRVSCKEITFV